MNETDSAQRERQSELTPPNLMSREQLLDAYYRDREEIAALRGTLLSALAHLEGRSDMSTDGNWEPLMIDLIRKRVGWEGS